MYVVPMERPWKDVPTIQNNQNHQSSTYRVLEIGRQNNNIQATTFLGRTHILSCMQSQLFSLVDSPSDLGIVLDDVQV